MLPGALVGAEGRGDTPSFPCRFRDPMSFTQASRRDGAAVGPEPPVPAPTSSPAAPGRLASRVALRAPGSAPRAPDREAPLEVAPADDPQEHEAEATAARVMRMPAAPAPSGASDPHAGSGGGERVQAFLASNAGEPLAPDARAYMEPRFGRGFGDVRVHTGPAAAESANSVGAAAYAVGRDVVFGAGRYRPETIAGRRLLAHELAHVAQHAGGVRRRVQRVSIYSYTDADPLHDPSRLSDATVQATDEYRYFSTFVPIPFVAPYATPAEALLAVRLLLRWLREGNSTSPYTNEWVAREFIDRAKNQLGALGGASAQVGHLGWVPFNTGQAVTNPAAMQSDFARWVLAGGAKPNTMSGSINCWEMVLFGAHNAGYITFPRIQQIYSRAVANVQAGTARLVGDTVETELRGHNAEHIFTPGSATSPVPLPGDVVIFNRAAVHVAIATGTVTAAGDHEVISLWNQPNNVSTVQRTTIEALLAAAGSGASPVRFWSAQW